MQAPANQEHRLVAQRAGDKSADARTDKHADPVRAPEQRHDPPALVPWSHATHVLHARERPQAPSPRPISNRATISTEYGGETASTSTAAAITTRPATLTYPLREIRFSSRPEGKGPKQRAQSRHTERQGRRA